MYRYYLYRHIRLDKNEPFYIGIGTKKDGSLKTYETEYKRAFSKQRKDSKIWKLVSSKTNYKVEILYESNDYEVIKQKEIEFIKLYGRIDLGTGTLANMTDGGDGTLGRKFSEETINKLKISRKKRGRYIYTNKIYQYDLNGNFIQEWESITCASIYIKVHKSRLSRVVKRNENNNFCKDYYWTNFLATNIEPKKYRNDFWGKVEMIDPSTNKVIQNFSSKEEALRFLGKQKSGTHIKNAIRNNSTAYGYKWKEVSDVTH